MLRIVLTGGTGFVGQAVLRRLARWDGPLAVRALVRGAGRLPARPWLTPVVGELPAVPAGLFFEDVPQVLVHLGTKQIDHDRRGFDAVNMVGTERLLAAAPESCVGAVYGSSISVYGAGAQVGLSEDAPLAPATPLARSRAAAEARVLADPRRGATVFRPRFIFGRGDRHTMPGLVKLVRRRLSLGTGRQAFTIVDVDDYAELIVRAAAAHAAGERRQRVLHAGYTRPISLAEITQVIRGELSLPPARLCVPVSERGLRALAFAPSLRTKLDLFGLPHHVDVGALARSLGADTVGRDAAEVIRQAVFTSHGKES